MGKLWFWFPKRLKVGSKPVSSRKWQAAHRRKENLDVISRKRQHKIWVTVIVGKCLRHIKHYTPSSLDAHLSRKRCSGCRWTIMCEQRPSWFGGSLKHGYAQQIPISEVKLHMMNMVQIISVFLRTEIQGRKIEDFIIKLSIWWSKAFQRLSRLLLTKNEVTDLEYQLTLDQNYGNTGHLLKDL